MPRLAMLLLWLSVAAAACMPGSGSKPAPTLATTSSTAPESAALADRIVVSTTSGSIAVHAADGSQIVRVDPPDGQLYRQPTWLDESTVVFSVTAEAGGHSLTAIDAESGAVVWSAPMETPPFYYLPSPRNAPAATTSLRNDPSGAGLIAEIVDGEGKVSLLSTESPFYASWSPDGASLAIHIAGQHLDIRREKVSETILSATGMFQTPFWVDGGLLTLRTVDGTQRLSMWNDREFSDIAEVEGPAGFVAVGTSIAIQAIQRPDTGAIAASLEAQSLPVLPGGKLIVIDQVAGSFETASNELALLYQWDTDGESLLFAVLGEEPQSLVWNVWSHGATSEIATFALQPPWFTSVVPFFNQYAQSVQLWSSSGDFIGYPAVVGAAPVVIIQSTGGGAQVVIDEAIWAAWAPRG